MAKTSKVKWALGADEPEDLQEFLSNDDIVLKNTNKKTKVVNWPSKGPHTFKVRFLKVKPNKNGDDRISVMLVLHDAKGNKDSAWNGYAVFDGFNVTEQGAPWIKRFLRALGLEWSDFINKTKQDDQDPPHIVQIAGIKFESGKDVLVRATTRVSPPDDFNSEEYLDIARYLPADDEEPEGEPEDEPEEEEDEADEEDDDAEDFEDEEDDEDEDDEDEDDEDDEEVDEDEEDEEDEDDDEEDEDEEDDAVEELTEELNGLKLAALRKRARRNDKKSDEDFENMKKPALIQAIIGQELDEPPF